MSQYHKTERTLKYAIMFIGLTFLTFFIIEAIGKNNPIAIHPFQYILIGLALILFYLLLLSLSEHIGFSAAYLVGSISIIAMISTYANSILRSFKSLAMITGVLGILYAYLYIILQLEDYALLMGSVSLFVVLGIVMAVTRKIEWGSLGTKP